MKNSVLTKKTSAIFLAIVLVAGTIALSSPSFMTGAQAVPEYGMDSYDKKSYGKDNSYKSKDSSNVIVKKVKCNNVNVNVNGLELDGLPPSLGGLLNGGEGDEGQYGANSYGSNGYGGQQSGYDNKNSFKFVCINNNNNTVIGTEEEPIDPCVECFTENLSPGQLNNLTSILSNSDLRDLEGLCEALSNSTLTNQQKITLLSDIFIDAGITIETDIDAVLRVLNCLDELGLIIPPPIGSPNSIR